jgi:hypothetical protein
VFAGQLPKEGDTADDQFTFGRRAILSINDIGEDSSRAGENPISRIEDNIENAMDAFVWLLLIRTIIKMYPNLEDRYTILLKFKYV